MSETTTCIRCGKPADRRNAYGVRLNNRGLPNGPNDKWGFEHSECATDDDVAELDGSKYFGKGMVMTPTSISRMEALKV